MEKKTSLLWRLEIIWWVFTIIVVISVLFPIYSTFEKYQFYLLNIVFIVTFITFTRTVFLFRFSFWSRWQYVKVALMFLCIPLMFYLVNGLGEFRKFMDELDINEWVATVPDGERNSLVGYIRNEMTLFGVGSIISTVILPMRMMLSVWRQKNRGTV